VSQPATNPRIVQFGLFELDLDARELRKSGMRIRLQEQPFQILAMLLERPGGIVTREELQKRLWPQDTFVDFDLSLNSAVKKLRQALGDDSENPRFIETLYRRGYRFIGPANGAATREPVSGSSVPSKSRVDSEPGPAETRIIVRRLLAWIVPVLLVLIAAIVWLSRPSPPPRITGYTQITHDGLFKETIVTDGERLYFDQSQSDHSGVAQVSVGGGESGEIAVPFKNVFISDIARDGSALLVFSVKDTQVTVEHPSLPLWSIPLPTGPPQRLNDASGQAAT
jgi:DNA-binding winged helix-turn-helix (wHTH) protein